jgi:polysaccharide deacetylase family protein (PEP-CTERM system associated)
MIKESNKNIVLTIDVEDWFHSLDYQPEIWNRYERRVEFGTRKILELLNEKKSKATFFVLGEVAENHPDLIREIHHEGHEIGSHSYYHKFIYKQSVSEFREDLRRSLTLLSDLIGEKIISFRAPYFSITKESLWALDILKEEGIECDSSIFPVFNHRYGITGFKRLPQQLENGIWEWPVTTYNSFGVNIPFSGGVYFRLLPLMISSRLHSSLLKMNEPVLLYFHPWEFDPGQPKLKGISTFLSFRHYFGLRNNFNKFSTLIKDLETRTISQGIKLFEENQ